MGKRIQKIINRFDGGVARDIRVGNSNQYAVVKNFDAKTRRGQLAPHYLTEAEEDKTYEIVKFLYAPYTTSYRLYGLGVVVGSSAPKLYLYDIDDGFGNWSDTGYLKAGAGARDEDVLFYYKDYVYVFTGGTTLQRVDITNTTNDFANYQSITYTTAIQPVHHSSDDNAYFFAENVVYRLDDTSWDGAVLTLPDNLRITSAVEYGNYLAIGAVTKGASNAGSVVFLWDRNSSLETISQRIDIGLGRLVHLTNIENKLFAVVDYFLSSSVVDVNRGKILIKQIVGGTSIKVNEILTDNQGAATGQSIPEGKFYQTDDRFYFVANPKLRGDSRGGIWALDANGNVSLEYMEFEAVKNAGTTLEYYALNGIYQTGNVLWVAHSNDGSVNRTDDALAFDTTNACIYESLIINDKDSSKKKKLIGVEVMTESLPTNGQVVIKYRKDEDINVNSATTVPTWTTISTEATDDSISHGAINIETTGDDLPEFKEIQFRVESTGGAVITGIRYLYERVGKTLF